MCLAQGHNAAQPVRLEPAIPQSLDKHSITALPLYGKDMYLCTRYIVDYNKTCVKQPLKNRQDKGLNDNW